MYQNPYFLEKSMEQHNQKVEREARKGWWNSKKQKPEQSKEKRQEPKAPAAHSAPECEAADGRVCGCQAYSACQA